MNILVNSAGTAPALGIVKCFRWLDERQHRIVTTDIVDDVPAAAFSDVHHLVPPFTSSEYFLLLHNIVEKEGIDVIFPTHLDEILYLSRIREDLPDWYSAKAILNPPEIVRVANDKSRMGDVWINQGGLVPERYQSPGEVREEDLPVVLKPAQGASRGYLYIFLAKTLYQLNILFEQYPGQIIQKHISGTEYSIDFIAVKGDIVGLCSRVREHSPTGVSVKGFSVDPERFLPVVEKAIEALPGIWFGNIQGIEDQNEDFYLIEVNPKLPGTLIHSAAAGLNMPVLLADLKQCLKISPVFARPGVKMVRFYDELFQFEPDSWRRIHEI